MEVSFGFLSSLQTLQRKFNAKYFVFCANAIDCVVYHEGRTSPEHSNVRYGLEVKIHRSTGLPSIVIEADAHDLRLFSMRHIQQQVLDFLEQHDGSLTDLATAQEVI